MVLSSYQPYQQSFTKWSLAQESVRQQDLTTCEWVSSSRLKAQPLQDLPTCSTHFPSFAVGEFRLPGCRRRVPPVSLQTEMPLRLALLSSLILKPSRHPSSKVMMCRGHHKSRVGTGNMSEANCRSKLQNFAKSLPVQ